MNEGLDFLITQLKSRRQQIEDLEREMKELRQEYDERVRLQGNYKSAAGSIEMRKASQRVTYDSRIVLAVSNALLELAPALAAQLESAKKISFIEATWAVK